ncbi:hypothetical protein [Mucilaginibacter sp. SP1R1]|uniref:hypothetical protein n=1 Tax=Mucilaginibacter sp. SP1R1 TaxID=2723091 RepID=UPI003AFFF3C1
MADRVMRMSMPIGDNNSFFKPAANLVQRDDSPTKPITEGASVVKDQLDDKPGFEEWQDKQIDALKKELWDKQPLELKAGIIGFGLSSLGILGAAFAGNPAFRANTIKLLDDKNIALPLSLIPYHDYFPLSSFKYKLPSAAGAPVTFDTEFEFKPYLEMMHEKWNFIPKADITLGLSAGYSASKGFDVTGGSIKLKLGGGIINLQAFINDPLPPTPMLVSGAGESPMWIMRTLPGQYDDQLPKGKGVFLTVDVLRLPELWHPSETKKTDVQRKPASAGDGVTAFVPKEGETGDAKDDPKPQTVETTEIKASNDATCDPQGVTYDEFLKSTGNVKDAFGITKLTNNGVTFPQIVLSGGVLQKTSAGIQVSSFYLKPQIFKDTGVVILQEDDRTGENNFCSRGKYERYWNITTPGANKVKEGEQEHCNDFKLAYTLSLVKFRDAVNAAAGKKFASEKQAKAYLLKQTKVDPDHWNDYFWCLASKTEDRDKMNWHLPKNIKPRLDKKCEKAMIYLNDINLPEIGKHSSAEVVDGCDGKQSK